MEKYLYTSDEYRSKDAINLSVNKMLFGPYTNIFYEIGDFQGLIVFAHIIPEHKAELIFKIWDKDAFSKDFLRASRKLVDLVMDEFKLARVTTHSADPKMVRMAKMVGMKQEGESPQDTKWNGKLFTSYTLGLVRET